MIGYLVDALPRSLSHALVMLQPPDPRPGEDPPVTSVMLDWEERRPTRLEATALVGVRVVASGSETLVVGRLGQVMVSRDGGWREEAIEGPQEHGFLCDARSAGGTVYVVGMDRQVYRRAEPGRWQPIHRDILDQSLDVEVITGFRSIDATRSGDLYASGFRGEIGWFHDGSWELIESPTNAILEQIRVRDDGRAMAVGQAGTVLIGAGHEWRVVQQSTTEDDFWGLEWFRGSFYLATLTALYRFLEPGELEPLDTGALTGLTCCRLRAAEDSLWSIGQSDVLRTRDGDDWVRVDLGDVRVAP